MSIHIAAKTGDIAETVLISGDPLRARHIAETMFEKSFCYNEIRGMLGFTGSYRGKRVSVQGTGMGLPSTAIYVHELITEYGVKNIIRIGTCGAIQPEIKLGELILAMGASTDSGINKLFFNGMDYTPMADFGMLMKAFQEANKNKIPVRVGNVFSTDIFYHGDPGRWKIWQEHGVLGVEMETNSLYTLAARHKVKALSALVVSDNIINGEALGALERERIAKAVLEVVLEVV